MERSKRRLKDRLARVFRGSVLLRSACAPSSTATSGSRSILDGIAKEPVFVPSSRRHLLIHDHLEHRSLSLPAFSDSHREYSAVAGRDLSFDCVAGRPCRSSSNIRKKTSSSPSKSSKKKLLSNPYGFTSSSAEKSDDEFGFFSSDEKEAETGTLFSSKSFSSDSSEFYQRPSSNNKNKKKKKQGSSSSSRRPPRTTSTRHSHNGFRPVVSMKTLGDHKGKEKLVSFNEEDDNYGGITVVKRTFDPYADFRSSMVEMIVEQQMFSADELERLLVSYLSLNSYHHHPDILQAFSDICDVLFAY